MQLYTNNVQDRYGNALVGASVTIRTGAGDLATLYSDNGVTLASNPLKADSTGEFAFYAANGRYTFTVAAAGMQSEIVSAFELADALELQEAATGGAAVATTKAAEALASANAANDAKNTATAQAEIATDKAAQTAADRLQTGEDRTAARDSAANALTSENAASGQADLASNAAATTQTLRDSIIATQGSIGYLPPVAYAAGLSMTLPAQTVSYSGQAYAPLLSALPFTTGGTFEVAKFRLIQGVTSSDLADTTDPTKGAAIVGRSIAIPVASAAPVQIDDHNLNIGTGVSLSPRDTFLAKKIITGLTNSHAFRDESEITGNTDGGYYGAFDAATKFSGVQNADHHHSYQDRLAWASSGTLSKHSGLYSYPVLSAGTVTERNGVEVGDYTGAGAATINTGLRIKPLLKGVNNYAIVSEGAAPSYHVGTFTIGAVPVAGSGINYRGTTLTGASQAGIASNGSGNAAATSSYSAFSGAPYLLAGATTTSLYGYAAQLAGGGAGAVITNNFGFWTADQGIGVNNFGYYSVMSAGAAKWAFYAGGTAKSYFNGAVGFGSGKTAPTAKVHIAAGSATAGTAPIKIDSGPVMTTPETGAFEFDGASLFFTVGGIRKTVTLT